MAEHTAPEKFDTLDEEPTEVPAEKKQSFSSDQYVVLDGALTGWADKDRKQAVQHTRGQVFTVKDGDGLYDVDRLVALGSIASAQEVADNGAPPPMSALQKSHAAARYSQQQTPVLDLTVQPVAPMAPLADPITGSE